MVRVPAPPPPWRDALFSLPSEEALKVIQAAVDDEDYLPWDNFRRRPTPAELTPEQAWLSMKFRRSGQYRELPFTDSLGAPFVYALPDPVLSGLDEIGRRLGGPMNAPGLVANPQTRDRYLINSLMEESITSSQLEGAATTRRVAREMLRSGREPRGQSEQMIVNNYRAMQFVRDNLERDLTPSLVLELHRIVTYKTLDDAGDAGRLQLPGETRVGVWSEADDVLIHQPPPAEDLPRRLELLCRFANGKTDGPWMHAALRAIIVHFMVGFDHYFVDGNGRTARALFYWVALRNGLWLLEFVAISRVLKDAPAQYARAYLHSEQDEGDLTYFALHQIKVIRRSIEELHLYLERKSHELVEARELAAGLDLNHRQMAVVEGALRDTSLRITVRSHAASHNVTGATARTDLRALESLGVLVAYKEGRGEVWQPVKNVAELLPRIRSS